MCKYMAHTLLMKIMWGSGKNYLNSTGECSTKARPSLSLHFSRKAIIMIISVNDIRQFTKTGQGPVVHFLHAIAHNKLFNRNLLTVHVYISECLKNKIVVEVEIEQGLIDHWCSTAYQQTWSCKAGPTEWTIPHNYSTCKIERNSKKSELNT